MKNYITICCLFIIAILCTDILWADSSVQIKSKDQSVILSAESGNKSNVYIALHWLKNDFANKYTLYRKPADDVSWTLVKLFNSSDTSDYKDTKIIPGVAYEYNIIADCTGFISESVNGQDTTYPAAFKAYGYIAAGVEVPEKTFGKVLILVDSTMINSLNIELENLEKDLITEGWKPKIIQAPRAENFDSSKVFDTKRRIYKAFENENYDRAAILIIGRVPVPYSGDLNPDGHGDHKGAWPSDIYYGHFDDEYWTDTEVDDTSAGREENKNRIGDGKFDMSYLDADASVPVGRVDFYKMTKFYDNSQANPELELVRRYLNKNHQYRIGNIEIKNQGVIDDNFGGNPMLEAFASSGIRNFPLICGSDNVKETDFLTSLSNDSYLMSYGCGGGTYTSAGGIGSTDDFVTNTPKSIHSFLFGSYFGDWDSENNFLRAAICSGGNILTCAWAGRPQWYLQNFANGEYLGYSELLSQNNDGVYHTNYFKTINYPNGVYYTVGNRGVHTALMGDPTLRLYSYDIKVPKINMFSEDNENRKVINWNLSNDTSIIGYNVYRKIKDSAFVKLNSSYIPQTPYIDSDKVKNIEAYMVCAVKPRKTPSGTIYCESRGDIYSVMLSADNTDLTKAEILIYPNPAQDYLNIKYNYLYIPISKIEIFDIEGKLIISLNVPENSSGEQFFSIELKDKSNIKLDPGVYMLKYYTGNNIKVEKFVVNK